jgi:uncharacterized protein (DUF433 family)
MNAINWSRCPLVESDPEKHHGSWVVRDTRLPISVAFGPIATGASIADVIDWYGGVSAEQITGLFIFVADSLEAADQPTEEDGPKSEFPMSTLVDERLKPLRSHE